METTARTIRETGMDKKMERIIDELVDKYKGLSSDTKKNVKYGLQWTILQLQNIDEDIEKVTRCKNCEWCCEPIQKRILGNKLYCMKLKMPVNPKNHCCLANIDEYE